MSTRPHVWTPFWRRFTDERATNLRDTITLHAQVTSAWRSSFWAGPDAHKTAALHIFKKLNEFRPVPSFFRKNIKKAIEELLRLETPIFTTADINWQAAHLSLKDQVNLRRFLRSQQYFLANEERVIDVLVEIVLSSLAHVIDALPEIADEADTTLSLPLVDALTTAPADVVERIVATVMSDDLDDVGLFTYLRETIYVNACQVAGIKPFEDTRKEFVPASKADMPPAELIDAYLSHTPFYDLFSTQVPFRIPKDKWSEHAIIIARPGFGKSQLIASFIADALQDPDRAIILLDPHGDLFRNVRDRVPYERLVVIDTDSPPPLNVFDYSTSSEEDAFNTFKFFLSSLAGGLSPKQETCILPLFELLKSIEGATLLTLHDIITERPKKSEQSKFAEAIEGLDDVHRDFFQHLFYSGNFQETRDSLQWKLIAALGRPTFRKMFSAPRNSIDLGRFIEERKVVVVRGSDKALGKDGLRIFFLFLVAQYYAAGKRRDDIPERRRHLAQMFIDEASTVLSSTVISDILVELRKYQCALIAATQVWEQVAQEVKPAVLGATSIKCVGEVQYNDRVVLSRDMNTTPEFLQNCKAIKGSHANWAFYVTEMTDRAVKVRVPYGVLEDLPIISSRVGYAPLQPQSLSHPSHFAQAPENGEKTVQNAGAPLTRTTAEVNEDEEDFDEDEREWMLADMKAAEEENEAREPTIKPGRDWGEPT